jgi:hypothetical protein
VGCIFATQTLCLASVLLCLPVAANSLLMALNRELFISINKAIGAALVYVLSQWTASRGGSLNQIAICAATGYFVAGVLPLVQVLGRYYTSKLALALQIGLCYVPLAWCMGALRVSGMIARAGVDPLSSPWWLILTRLGVFLVLMVPVVLYGNARTGLFGEFRRIAARLARRGRPSVEE